MAQKANLITLRKKNYVINCAAHGKTRILKLLALLSQYKKFLLANGVLLCQSSAALVGSGAKLEVSLFFMSGRLTLLKKKLKKKFKAARVAQGSGFTARRFFREFPVEISKVSLLNSKLASPAFRGIAAQLRKLFKKFSPTLFARRQAFLVDSCKICVLFSRGHVSSAVFLEVLGNIFKFLRKKRHSRYIMFVKDLFKLLVKKSRSGECRILGVKFRLNGKLRGKPRSGACLINVGRAGIQSLGQPIQFSKQSVFTVYGVFGLRLWVNINKHYETKVTAA